MTNHLLRDKLLHFTWLFFLTVLSNVAIAEPVFCYYTDTLNTSKKDTVKLDTVAYLHDTTLNVRDTLTRLQDSTAKTKKPEKAIEDLIERYAKDSIVQDIADKKVYLYGDAQIKYGNIELKAANIIVNFKTNTVFAVGVKDSTGKVAGRPEFSQGDQKFEADTIRYNFDSGKGYINNIYTSDGQGYLLGEIVKKLPDNSINVYKGRYTTCTLRDHPHFSFNFKKARVIPDNKIVTGPAYMDVEGVPTPLAVPFGLFPNNTKRKSGIIIPTYGESPTRGFYLEGGGYYWAISDYMDLTVLGDIYSYGSWAVKPTFRYKKRYKFNGSFSAQYAVNVVSDKDSPDYSKSNDFMIRWTHAQDPKARPNSRFNANVNIVTSNYVKYNVTSIDDYLSNEFQSSISYQTGWQGKYYLTASANHRQNTKTHDVSVTLPELTFSVNRFYPLKRKKSDGKKRFYEDLAITYSMNGRNEISTVDSLLFAPQTLKNNMKNGIVHKLPISLPMKVFKYFIWSNSMNVTDRMYASHIERYWVNDTIIDGNDTVVGFVKQDTVSGFNNVFDFSFSSSLSTKLYGMLRFKKGPVRAIRHVFTPSVNFNYTPEFGNNKWGYYDSYIDGDGEEIFYYKYDGYLYGKAPQYKSGRVGFSFSNTLEIKVPSKKDTVTGMKKIVLLKSLNVSGNYDLAKDSLNMSYLTVTGRTTLWKNLDLKFGAQFDPYAADSMGRRINVTNWEMNKRLFRKTHSNWALSFHFRLSDKDFKKDKKTTGAKKQIAGNDKTKAFMDEYELDDPNDYIDWNIPWSLDLNYTFNYVTTYKWSYDQKTPERRLVNTLGFSGQINITPKWKVTFRSGYDFTGKQISLTSLSLYRDLHCWEMRFNVIPFGPRQSWNFSINVKSGLLQDLKLNKKKDFRDY